MYTIGQASTASGVPAVTIRAWERRYGLLSPSRTESGYRMYSEEEVGRLRRMASLVATGVPAGRAAHVLVNDRSAEGPVSRRSWGEREDGRTSLCDLALSLEAQPITDFLDAHRAEVGLDALIDDWLMPELTRLGQAWADGEVDVALEHLASATVQRWLSQAHDEMPQGDGPLVVIGLPAGARHELGLLSLTVCLRERGMATVYLGADVPLDSWEPAVVPRGARAVVLAAPRRRDAKAAREARDVINTFQPPPRVWIGGAAGDDTLRMGTRIAQVADEIGRQLRAPGVPR